MYEWSLAQGADNYVLVTAEKAQLRAGPSEDAPSRGEVVQGNALYVGYYIDGWILASTHPCVRDRAERAEGWIDSRHVAFNAPYARLTRSSGAYTWPAEDAERIERLREGEEVPVIAETDESYIVLREGGVGFVQKNAAELVHAPQRTYINGEYALKDVAVRCSSGRKRRIPRAGAGREEKNLRVSGKTGLLLGRHSCRPRSLCTERNSLMARYLT